MTQDEVIELAEKVLKGNRASLAQAITLVESQNPSHWPMAKLLLEKTGGSGKSSFRLGISGPPGVGKSTFIEAFGRKLLSEGRKIAVLAIDPSSQITGGSILGDKTRMEQLSRHPEAFVRPSPSRGHLGGVTASMPAALMLCEAAGFDWIFVETVGVGQSEVEVKSMVDHLTMLAQPGSGDELQGIKKGILEFVDSIVVNKADINPGQSRTSKQQLLAALKVMRGRDIPVFLCSSVKGDGFDELFHHYQKLESSNQNQRDDQNVQWMKTLIKSQFIQLLDSDPKLTKILGSLESDVRSRRLMPFEAADQFFKKILGPLG